MFGCARVIEKRWKSWFPKARTSGKRGLVEYTLGDRYALFLVEWDTVYKYYIYIYIYFCLNILTHIEWSITATTITGPSASNET